MEKTTVVNIATIDHVEKVDKPCAVIEDQIAHNFANLHSATITLLNYLYRRFKPIKKLKARKKKISRGCNFVFQTTFYNKIIIKTLFLFNARLDVSSIFVEFTN